MTGPQNVDPRPMAMGAFDELRQQFDEKGWDFLEEAFAPALVHRQFEPEEAIKRFAAALYRSAEGRKFVDFLLNLTCRAPYPVTSQSGEDLKFAAAKHQARAAVGEVLVKVISEGQALLDRKEP